MAVLSKFSDPGKQCSGFSECYARYKSNFDRVALGSSSSYLSPVPSPNLLFRRCSARKCKTCPRASSSQIINDTSEKYIKFCKAYNIIYKLICNNCPMQYIGQTCTPLHLRINNHRKDIKAYNHSAHNSNINAEFHHFQKHDFSNVTIEILAMEKNFNERLFLESSYISHLNTTYPYGLNQLINNKPHPVFSNISNYSNYTPIYSSLNLTQYKKTNRTKRGTRRSNKSLSNLHIKKDLISLYNLFNTEFNWLKVRKFIFSIKKKFLPKYFKIFNSCNFDYQFNDLFFDLIYARANFVNANLFNSSRRITPNTNFTISFTNPVFNKININSIINNNHNPFPLDSVQISKSFKYPTSLGRRIFNYNKFSKNLTPSNLTCVCNEPSLKKYLNIDHGHIITGNLEIVENSSLRKLMNLGTKFRLPTKFKIKDIIAQFTFDIDLFIYKIALSYSKPIEYFNEWKFNLLNNFSTKLFSNKKFIAHYPLNNLHSVILNLQNNFIITYVDKSPNNYAIICKSYYNKLLTDCINSNQIFTLCSVTLDDNNKKLLSFHKLLDLKLNNFNYPYLVLIPKFHKNPVSFRSVTVGCNSYNLNANQLLLKILKKIYNCSVSLDNTHCLKNSSQLVEKLHNLTSVQNITTYDFKDLFNNISIDDLHKVINHLFVEFYHLLSLPPNYDADYFGTLTNFLLYHNYIIHNDLIYIQSQGIPQGGCASSLLADLYLYFYERSFNNNSFLFFRYIDDIIKIHFDSSNSHLLPVNYPPNLVLTVNHLSSNSINFLDLKISLSNYSILIDIYDKRQDFNFHVNTYTNFKSCLHISVFRNILINHLFRIKSLCSNQYKNKNINILISTAQTYNYPKNFIKSIIKNS